MFFISPIKAIYSIKFYLQQLKEPLWKAFLFFVYISAIAAVFLAVSVPIKMNKEINAGIDKLAELMPNITVKDGIITVNNNRLTVIEDEVLQDYKIVFDTASTGPVYPTQLEKEKIAIYANKNAFYTSVNGQLQETKMDKKFNVELSKQEVHNNRDKIAYTIKYFFVVIAVFILALRLLIFTLIALVIAAILNAVYKLDLSFKELLILTIYLQAPVIVLDVVMILLPLQIIGMGALLAIIIYVVYINLIFTALRTQSTPKARVAELLEDDEEE